MANRRVLKVEILGDSRGVQRAFSETRSAANRLGDNFRQLGRSASLVFAGITTGAALLGRSTIEAASDVEEALSKSAQIFGDAADQIRVFSETAATELGQSQATALEAAATFGIFGKAAGLTGEDLGDFSIELTELASDLASFNNSSPEEAIQAIGAALRGESEPIRAYGILLNDATLKARALEMGIYDGNGALDLQAKILAAQAEIFAQSTDAQGDYARTADGVANASRQVRAQFENLKSTIGKALLPVTQELLGVLTVRVLPALGRLAEIAVPKVQDAFETLREKLEPVVDTLRERFAPIIDRIVEFARQNTSTITAFFAGFGGTALAAALTIAVGAIGSFVAKMLLVPTLIGAAVAAFTNLYETNEEFRRRVDAAIGFVTNTVLPALVTAAQAVRDWLTQNWPTVRDTVVGVISGIIDFVQRNWPTVRDTMVAVAEAVLEFLAPVFEAVSREVGATIDFVVENWPRISEAVGNVIDAVTRIIGELRPFLEPILTFIRDVFISTVVTAFETLRGGVRVVLDLLTGDIGGAFGGMIYLVTRPILLIGRFLKLSWETIRTTTAAAVGRIADVLRLSKLGEIFTGLFDGVATTVAAIFSAVVDGIVAAINFAIRLINDATGLLSKIPGVNIPEIDEIGNRRLNFLPPEPAFMAAGGIVTAPTLAVIGEAGPEAVVPLSKAGAMGATYNVTVNAGLGTDGTQVGAQIVDAIRRFERSSGAGWRAA